MKCEPFIISKQKFNYINSIIDPKIIYQMRGYMLHWIAWSQNVEACSGKITDLGTKDRTIIFFLFFFWPGHNLVTVTYCFIFYSQISNRYGSRGATTATFQLFPSIAYLHIRVVHELYSVVSNIATLSEQLHILCSTNPTFQTHSSEILGYYEVKTVSLDNML